MAKRERNCWAGWIPTEPTEPGVPAEAAEAAGMTNCDPAWCNDVVPVFGPRSLTPGSTCAHRGPFPAGSLFYCDVCGQSGMDGHPALIRTPATDPRPEPKPKPTPAKGASAKPIRKARRAAIQGEGRLTRDRLGKTGT